MTTEFQKALILTTPPISGKRVRDAQWLLAGHNVFSSSSQSSQHIATLTGRIDGVYGPVTAGAVKDAKFYLGYDTPDINTAFGQTLYEYLTGGIKLPQDYETRRAKRIQTPAKIKALEWAVTQIGVKEEPSGSNDTPYGKWYGENGVPWCAIFVSYGINYALGTLNHPVWKYAYVPSVAQDAALGRNHMSLTYAPQPGDLVTYNWDGPNCHIEFYGHDLGNGSFSAIGGNTGPNIPSSNGGIVCSSVRYENNVSHFVRLNLPLAA